MQLQAYLALSGQYPVRSSGRPTSSTSIHFYKPCPKAEIELCASPERVLLEMPGTPKQTFQVIDIT